MHTNWRSDAFKSAKACMAIQKIRRHSSQRRCIYRYSGCRLYIRHATPALVACMIAFFQSTNNDSMTAQVPKANKDTAHALAVCLLQQLAIPCIHMVAAAIQLF